MITKDELRVARAKMRQATQAFNGMAQNYALQQCPFKKGDKLTVLGKAHRGKTIRVESIRAVADFTTRTLPEWKVTGPVLKADGSDSAYQASVHQIQWDSLMDDCGGDLDVFWEELVL